MQKLIDHPHVTHAEVFEAAMRDGSTARRALVRTSLVLDPEQPAYDKAAYDGLMDAIEELMERRTDITAVDIEGS